MDFEFSTNYVPCSDETVTPVLSDICENMVIGYSRNEELSMFYYQQISDMLNYSAFILQLILVFGFVYIVCRWLFNLVKSISLGW